MKAATGELNLTLITILALGAVLAFFWALWPSIKDKIRGSIMIMMVMILMLQVM